MPFALILIGLIMVVTAARNTHAAFGAQLTADFTGPGNFTYWILSIGAVGALGYVKPFEEMSRTFMLLIVLAMVIKNEGLFSKLQEAINLGPEAPTAAPEPQIPSLSQANPSFNPSGSAAQALPYLVPFL